MLVITAYRNLCWFSMLTFQLKNKTNTTRANQNRAVALSDTEMSGSCCALKTCYPPPAKMEKEKKKDHQATKLKRTELQKSHNHNLGNFATEGPHQRLMVIGGSWHGKVWELLS